MTREIPISWHSFGGWFIGHTVGTGHRNMELRTAQYRTSFDPTECLRIAKGLVVAKIQNCRTLLRRNWKRDDRPDELLEGFQEDIRRAQRARNLAAASLNPEKRRAATAVHACYPQRFAADQSLAFTSA